MFGKKERTMIFMARSTKSYEERMLQLEKKEQESLEKENSMQHRNGN